MILGAGSASLDRSILHSIGQAFDRLSKVSTKLSTLKRINRGSDDPAGLIAADNLSRELSVLRKASESTERARSLVHVADTGLAHASSLLTELEGKVVAAASDTLSPEQKEALQQEVDASLDAINRLGKLSFNGQDVFGQSHAILVGPEPHQTASLNLPPLDDSLGGDRGILADLRSGGVASLSTGDPALAADILGQARSQVLGARTEAGAFERYVLDSAQRVMQDTEINLARARSAVLDTDVAAESSGLVRELILSKAALATAKLANGIRRTSHDLLVR